MTANPPLAIWLSAAVACFAAAATLTTWLAPWLARRGAAAVPGPDGRGRALPRGGGLAIVVVVVGAGLVAGWLYPEARTALAAWLVPGLAVAAVSLRDDFSPLPALVRLVVHVAAAAVLVAAAGPVREVSLGGVAIDLGLAAWPLTLLWVVGMTNAFNFMDGIDGIAGITAAATAAGLAVAAGAASAEPVVIIALAVAAGALGFLTSNWPPARIFMGDVGSTFCGFTLAAMPLVAPPQARAGVLAAAALALWPFVFDTSLTFLRRLLSRENILQPHCGHIYQRLALAGWSHRAVASLYGFLAATGGGIAAMGVVWPETQASAGRLAVAEIVLVPALLITLMQASEARNATGSLQSIHDGLERRVGL